MNFAKATTKPAAMLNFARLYDKVENTNMPSFNIIPRLFRNTTAAYRYNNRSTNDVTESFNSKIKSFITPMRCVIDISDPPKFTLAPTNLLLCQDKVLKYHAKKTPNL